MLLRMAGAIALSCVCGNAFATYGFDPVAALAPDAVGASSIAVGDVTGDGLDDVVVLGAGNHPYYRGKVLVYAQQPAGGFSAAVAHAFNDSATDPIQFQSELALADLDTDGALDIVVTYGRSGEQHLALLRNSGGQFEVSSYPSDTDAVDLRFMDVDQDGNLDILAKAWPNQVHVFHGNGSGGVRDAVTYPMLWYADTWQLADMDNDGNRDLVYIADGGIVMQRHENGGFSTATHNILAVPMNKMAVGDFNGDGRNDIAGTRYGSGSDYLTVYHQDRNGKYRRGRVIDSSNVLPENLAARDMNLDGRDDLITSRHASMIDMYISRTDGFLPRKSFVGGYLPVMSFGDLNQDGLTDIAMANGSVSLLFSRGAPIENDLAVFMGLVPNAAALRVENIGALASTSYSVRFHINARIGTLTFGTLPEGCWAYNWESYAEISCYGQPALSAGEHRVYAFPFSRSHPESRNTLIALGEISVDPDLRQDNNEVVKQLVIPATTPTGLPSAPTIKRKR